MNLNVFLRNILDTKIMVSFKNKKIFDQFHFYHYFETGTLANKFFQHGAITQINLHLDWTWSFTHIFSTYVTTTTVYKAQIHVTCIWIVYPANYKTLQNLKCHIVLMESSYITKITCQNDFTKFVLTKFMSI